MSSAQSKYVIRLAIATRSQQHNPLIIVRIVPYHVVTGLLVTLLLAPIHSRQIVVVLWRAHDVFDWVESCSLDMCVCTLFISCIWCNYTIVYRNIKVSLTSINTDHSHSRIHIKPTNDLKSVAIKFDLVTGLSGCEYTYLVFIFLQLKFNVKLYDVILYKMIYDN